MFAEFMNTYGMEIIAAILTAVLGTIGMAIKKATIRWLDTKEKKALAKIAVDFVEQTYRTIHGPEKMSEAVTAFSQLLMNNGIDCDVHEMEIMLEAAVKEMNKQAGLPTGEGQ